MNPDDPLALDPETMRQLGYRMVDLLVDHLARTDETPVLRTASRDEMQRIIDEPPPEEPRPFDEIARDLTEKVLPWVGRWDHPRFFGYIPGGGTWPAALGDFAASALNIDAGEWREAAGPSQLELTVLSWFSRWVGYPDGASGILTSGGSAANLQALAVAREALAGPMSSDIVVYVGDMAHSSVARGARALGFRPNQVRVVPTDATYRLRASTVAAAMDADIAAERVPLAVVAAAGATGTGAVDPLDELAELCGDRGVWLHVDAAYGGFAILTERGRKLLSGIELADSITLDPHKWLYMPFEVGCLLVREGHLLRSAFEIVPDYLKDTAGSSREVNFANHGLQLTRAAKAIKVWMSLLYFGVAAFRRAIDASMDLARVAEERIEASPDLELVTPVSLGVLTFRRSFPGVKDEATLERMNGEVVRALAESGEGLVSSTRIRGRYVIRFVVMNHASSRKDVLRVLAFVEKVEIPMSAGRADVPDGRSAEAGVSLAWLARTGWDARSLREIPLFRSLDDEQVERVRASLREELVEPGQTIVGRWEYSREFYVLVQGVAEVRQADRVLDRLEPGQFFGEAGAIDWGAGYSYARTASVVAVGSVQVLVLPGAVIDELFRIVSDVEHQIREAMRERPPKA